MREILRAALREPLVHFLLAGALLFAFFALRGTPADPASRTITVTAADVEQLAEGWRQTWQRPPTPEEREALIADHVREEVYYREGLRLGLDRDDPVVRRRVRAKMESILQSRMEAQAPGEADLRDWLLRHPDRYASGERLSLDQVWFAADAPGAQARVRQALTLLRQGADWRRMGDPVSLPASLEGEDRRGIASQFGDAFAEAVLALPQGQWQGPVRSGLGLHLVRVTARQPGRQPALSQVREAVEQDWRAATAAAREDQAYRDLLRAYSVRIERP